ncbi:MAG TPA: thioredoxin family protein [Blastocatellia bacterium]|nr:thioredoxin family protein [Blastocatellia bacterium]
MIVPLNIDTYPAFTRSKPVVLVHFRASWNRYDDIVKEKLQEIAPACRETVAIGSVDVDLEEFWQLASDHKITNIPALVYYTNGERPAIASGPCHKVVIGAHNIEKNLKHLLNCF